MRKIIGFILVGLWLGCSQPEGFKIDVTLAGGEGKIFLQKRGLTGFIPVDTAEFKNGKAVLKGKVDFPDLYMLQLEKNNGRTFLFVENTSMKVTGKADSLQLIKITGSPVNDEFSGIKGQLDADNKAAMEKYKLYQEAAQAGDTLKARELMQEVQNLSEAPVKKIRDFVKNNPSSWLTPIFLSELQSTLSVEELDTLVTRLDPKLSVSPDVAGMKKRIEAQKKVSVGQTAPDFTQNDPDGKPVKLSDVYSKNKYTLIDFWAAWCGPCRQENPNVVAVYNDFKGKGFTVFGVSLDQDRDRWLKAIQDDQLVWTQVSDLKYWQNAAAALYAVSSIPASFLVDNSGKIIARNLRGEELRNKLTELLP